MNIKFMLISAVKTYNLLRKYRITTTGKDQD